MHIQDSGERIRRRRIFRNEQLCVDHTSLRIGIIDIRNMDATPIIIKASGNKHKHKYQDQ